MNLYLFEFEFILIIMLWIYLIIILRILNITYMKIHTFDSLALLHILLLTTEVSHIQILSPSKLRTWTMPCPAPFFIEKASSTTLCIINACWIISKIIWGRWQHYSDNETSGSCDGKTSGMTYGKSLCILSLLQYGISL